MRTTDYHFVNHEREHTQPPQMGKRLGVLRADERTPHIPQGPVGISPQARTAGNIRTTLWWSNECLRPDKPSPRGTQRTISSGYSQPSSVLSEQNDPKAGDDFHKTSVMSTHGGTEWTLRPSQAELSSPGSGWAKRDMQWSLNQAGATQLPAPTSPRYVREALDKHRGVWSSSGRKPGLASSPRNGASEPIGAALSSELDRFEVRLGALGIREVKPAKVEKREAEARAFEDAAAIAIQSRARGLAARKQQWRDAAVGAHAGEIGIDDIAVKGSAGAGLMHIDKELLVLPE